MKHTFTPVRLFLLVLVSVYSTLSMAQTGSISGKVVSEKGEELIGATVKVKGTALGAACDIDGKFSLKDIPAGETKFIISYIGFTNKELSIDVVANQDNPQPNIVLKEDKMLLDEVVVVGYGTQVKKDLSSAISSVKGDDLKDKPGYNFASGLQGKASGVQITTDNGLAGAATSIRIRGTKTLSATAEPLYVVDGVPIVTFDISDASGRNGYNVSPLSSINPTDIENIEILKDAAATAIYGARGANGVVLVTTKSGKSGKSKIDFSYNTGITMPANKISMLDGNQYADLYNEAFANDNHITKDSARSYFRSKQHSYPNGITSDSISNTNWIDQMFRTGYFNDANVAISGGDDKTTFYAGMGLRDEKSFLKGNDFQRISLRANINHIVSKNLDFGLNTSITHTDNTYVYSGGSGGLGNAQSIMLPIYPIYNADSSYFTHGSNPLAQINLIKGSGSVWRSISNAFFNFHFLKYMTLHVDGGIDLINQQESFYKPKEITGDSAIAENRTINYLTWNFISTLQFKKEVKKGHDLEILVGFNPTGTQEKYSYIAGKGFAIPELTEPRDAVRILPGSTAGTGREYKYASFFGRIFYKINNRHLFQLSFRSDGSSRFASGNRWGYFPAASYGWVLSEEKFIKKIKQISLLKFRVSGGTSGNSDLSSDFLYFSTFNAGNNYAGNGGIAPSSPSVNNLTWETTFKFDAGIDFGFWNGRLQGLFDYYYEYTTNVLVQQYPLAPSSGYSSVAKNVGKIQNMGIELQLTSHNLGPKSKFGWKTQLNFGMNRNKVLDLGDAKEVSGTNYGDNRAIVGQPVGVWYLAKYAGVDPQTGQPLIYDLQGNKVVANATNSVTYRQPVGRPYPLFFGGLGNTFSYKSVDLEIFFTYSYGNNIYDDGGKRQLGNIGFGWNQDIRTLNRWQKPGDVTDVPVLSLNKNYDFNTTHYLYDASFLRMRTITLGYTLPFKTLAKMKMRNLRIYASAQNLFTITPYKGWDPETNRNSSGAITQGVTYLATPQARVFTFGVTFGL